MTLLRRFATAALVALMLAGLALPNAHAVTIDWVTVGNPGNANDTTGYGAVNYEYRIGKYEVTIGQYTAFLNAVAATDTYSLYNPYMATNLNQAGISRSGASGSYTYSVIQNDGDSSNRPITYVSWFDAARFANWMQNGQGSGSTETGAYTLNGAISGDAPGRNEGAQFYIPTENEWYKAAYYSPEKGGVGSPGYYAYATQSDTLPGNTIGSGANQANHAGLDNDEKEVYSVTQSSYSSSQNYLTDVGAFTNSASYYGTFDQTGNTEEWNDLNGDAGRSRFVRGGGWRSVGMFDLSSSRRINARPSFEPVNFGFRLAAPSAVPVGLTINVASGVQTQSEAGHALLSGSIPVLKTGGGALILDAVNTLTGSMSVQAGTLQLAHPSALASSRIVPLSGGVVTLSPGLQAMVGGLAANAGGLIDVGNGLITVTSGLSATDMVGAILTGMGDGSWNGTTGITSSVAAASGGTRTVGWLDNGDGSMVFALAAAGDTNLDWTVDLVDVVNFASSSKYGTGEPATWIEGDFNYDGIVDLTDVVDFSSTGLYGAGTYNTSSGSASIAAVPEPSTYAMALAGLACGISMWRRRRA